MLKIVKLGGALITKKDRDREADIKTIDRLVLEIKNALESNRNLKLIIVHGGGSFPHPVAKKYNVHLGFKTAGDNKEYKHRIRGFTLTAKAAADIDEIIWSRFLKHDVQSLAIRTSSIGLAKNGVIIDMFTSVIDKCLENGILPILYGDVIFDLDLGNSIASGEKIIYFLSGYYKPDEVIIATDVDGVFDNDPKTHPDAKLITDFFKFIQTKKVDLSNKMAYADVTGGMKHKTDILVKLAKQGIPSIIINGYIKDRLYNALIDSEVIGTYFRKSKLP